MNKILQRVRKHKGFIVLLVVMVCAGVFGMTSKAQTEKRASNIKSKGIFNYGNGAVVMDASDLTYLADEIDLLEETYKKKTVKALNEMNTYFMHDDSTTHDPDESNLSSDQAKALSFNSIISGILESQSIPEEKTYTGTLPGEEDEITGNIQAATEDGLSLGEAGWVDGELIIGNGANNNNFYNQGYADGLAEAQNASLIYNYHQHTGSPAKGTGCYTKPIYHQHVDSCIQREACNGQASDIHKTNLGYYNEDGKEFADWEFECSVCGHVSLKAHVDINHVRETYVCGKTTEITGWTLGCGKNEKTIESATIVFN